MPSAWAVGPELNLLLSLICLSVGLVPIAICQLSARRPGRSTLRTKSVQSDTECFSEPDCELKAGCRAPRQLELKIRSSSPSRCFEQGLRHISELIWFLSSSCPRSELFELRSCRPGTEQSGEAPGTPRPRPPRGPRQLDPEIRISSRRIWAPGAKL